jgi:hypothetical protein
VQVHKVYSDLLHKAFKVNITPNLLRTIDKKGGFDRYVLLTKEKNLDKFTLDLKPQLQKAFLASAGMNFSRSRVLHEERVQRAKAAAEARSQKQQE